jgi:hypothetical protein
MQATTRLRFRALAFARQGGIIVTLEALVTAEPMRSDPHRRRSLFLVWPVLLAAVAGCTSSSGTSPRGGAGEASGRLREVPSSKLPALADPSPTSDPAVEVGGPQGWKRLPRRDEQYLVGWYGGTNPNVLPRVFVKVEEWTGQAGDTTPDNLTELNAEIGRALESKKDQVLESPQAMLLGGEPWVRFVEEARLGNAQAEKQILQRVIGGRLFTVELQIYPGKILEARDQAYAVAAALQVHPVETLPPEGSPPPTTAPENPPPAPENSPPPAQPATAPAQENATADEP